MDKRLLGQVKYEKYMEKYVRTTSSDITVLEGPV
jgi:hypothetical protein